MKEIHAADLKQIEAFHHVPEDQLEWMIRQSSHYELAENAFLAQPGDLLNATHILISGRIEIYRLQNHSRIFVAELMPGSITGMLPFSRAKNAFAYLQCVDASQLMSFPLEKMRELIVSHYELTQALVIVMTTRVREFTELEQQNEKIMALGKLSAGLAHELNNPAAAIIRGSLSLKKHLQLQPDAFKKLISVQMAPEEIDAINEKLFAVLANKSRPVLTMMQRSEQEDELLEWLDDNQIDDVMDMAENFVEFGITMDVLEEMQSRIKKEDLSPVLTWINTNLTTERMVADIQEASGRIADLIGSVKSFTHMDRGGEKDFTDIHIGLRNTLIMLNYKLKHAKVKVIEDFDHNLPQLKAMVGELNQVWTNLIDNAIDALDGQPDPELRISTCLDKEYIRVTICDNGPGIPPEIRSRIFDPFFTTKPIGKGTGLGLDVVMRIVRQHSGSVTLHSSPGKTEFLVCFPING
ncbi:ATP-binding protein [Dyadobacter sediminis]|uniref:histidine kinase n=1 Tax=Dyadobacter sediminis TaxID=1493691 RepID=A0A5R9KIW1_9BACT|nr:ATP-binding protein [Dyadobacter sediminis]TLU96157.1 cyclic nucleotide-binding domain-containing protein [Dyadobacter sediminis]GGB79779.1 histidine kinase [Dyadobacter sediminis]